MQTRATESDQSSIRMHVPVACSPVNLSVDRAYKQHVGVCWADGHVEAGQRTSEEAARDAVDTADRKKAAGESTGSRRLSPAHRCRAPGLPQDHLVRAVSETDPPAPRASMVATCTLLALVCVVLFL